MFRTAPWRTLLTLALLAPLPVAANETLDTAARLGSEVKDFYGAMRERLNSAEAPSNEDFFAADSRTCTTWVVETVAEGAKPRGRGYDIAFSPREIRTYEFSVEEQLRLREGKWANGNITCPATVTLDHVLAQSVDTLKTDLAKMQAHDMTAEDRQALNTRVLLLESVEKDSLCLLFDPASQSYAGFQTGERDAYLECVRPQTFCDRFNTVKAEVLENGVSMAGKLASASSGAMIMTGPGGYVASTLGSAGVGIATAPVTLGAAAAALVGAGGIALLCH